MSKRRAPSRNDHRGVRRRRMRADAEPTTTGAKHDASTTKLCAFCGITIVERGGVWYATVVVFDEREEERAVCNSMSGNGGPHSPLEIKRKPRKQLGTLTREEYLARQEKKR